MTSVHVTLHPPRIDSDTVWFIWEGEDSLPPPPEGGLFYRFEGIKLERFSTELWLEIFLSLRLHALKRINQPVELRLPVPMPQPSIDFWCAYHGASNVTVTPVSSQASYSPWVDQFTNDSDSETETAVFFGGGRDSLATACLLGEVLGRQNVLLIQCVDPDQPTDEARRRRANRMEVLSLSQARDQLGFPVQRVRTNLRSLALTQGGRRLESHAEQFTAALLPVLLARGVRFSTFAFPWTQHIIQETPTGPLFRSPRSRPEALLIQSRHYKRTLGIDLQLIHIGMALNSSAAFDILQQRYPDAFNFILTCPETMQLKRWCYKCRRCARHAWHCLAAGAVTHDFDLDFMMTSSTWILAMIAAISTLDEIELDGYSPVPPESLVPAYDFPLMCDALYRADSRFAAKALSADGFWNFTILQAIYGNKPVPYLSESLEEAYRFIPEPIAGKLRSIIGQHMQVTEAFSTPLFTAQGPALGPFDLPLDLEFLNLPHLQLEH